MLAPGEGVGKNGTAVRHAQTMVIYSFCRASYGYRDEGNELLIVLSCKNWARIKTGLLQAPNDGGVGTVPMTR